MNETAESESHDKRPRGLGRAGPVALIAMALPITGSLATVALGPLCAQWLRAQGTIGAVYFTLAYIVLAAFALAPTYSAALIAGWTFGFKVAVMSLLVGTVIGAVLCYLNARKLASDRVSSTYLDHPRWDIVRRALLVERPLKTMWIVMLLRFSPVLPFGATNVLLATSGVRLPIYTLGTLLGILPRVGLIALAGSHAQKLDLNSPQKWWFLALGAVATGLCILIMLIIGKSALARATRPSA